LNMTFVRLISPSWAITFRMSTKTSSFDLRTKSDILASSGRGQLIAGDFQEVGIPDFWCVGPPIQTGRAAFVQFFYRLVENSAIAHEFSE
jgi:hypothetical protein